MQPTQTTPLLSADSRGSHYGSQARTATADAAELSRRSSVVQEEQSGPSQPSLQIPQSNAANPHEPRRLEFAVESIPSFAWPRRRSVGVRRRSVSRSNSQAIGEDSGQMHDEYNKSHAASKTGLVPRPVGGNEKLGMFSGVFVPTSLNVLSILMFLRFGFILGQGGVIGIMGECIVARSIQESSTSRIEHSMIPKRSLEG